MSYFSPAPARPVVSRDIPTSLRDTKTPSLVDGSLAFVWGPRIFYYWSSTSLDPDNSTTVIKPNSVSPLDPGRWLLRVDSVARSLNPSFVIDGAEYSAAGIGAFIGNPIYISAFTTITSVLMHRRFAGLAGVTNVEIRKNGVAITAPFGVSVGDGDYASSIISTFAPLGSNNLIPGDYIEAVITAVETYKAGPPEGPEGLSIYLIT